MIKSILVPIDGSDHALKALDLASEIAVANDAELLLLHAVVDGELSVGQERFAEVEHIEGPREQIHFAIAEQRLMSGARKRARAAGVKKLESAIEPGDPAQVIIERSKEFDMVVMGRRGLGPIKGLLQGSVSQKVGQLADAACATVK